MTNFIPRDEDSYIKICDYCGRNEATHRVFNLEWTGFSICGDCMLEQIDKELEKVS